MAAPGPTPLKCERTVSSGAGEERKTGKAALGADDAGDAAGAAPRAGRAFPEITLVFTPAVGAVMIAALQIREAGPRGGHSPAPGAPQASLGGPRSQVILLSLFLTDLSDCPGWSQACLALPEPPPGTRALSVPRPRSPRPEPYSLHHGPRSCLS